jgi:hypothetical protein
MRCAPRASLMVVLRGGGSVELGGHGLVLSLGSSHERYVRITAGLELPLRDRRTGAGGVARRPAQEADLTSEVVRGGQIDRLAE